MYTAVGALRSAVLIRSNRIQAETEEGDRQTAVDVSEDLLSAVNTPHIAPAPTPKRMHLRHGPPVVSCSDRNGESSSGEAGLQRTVSHFPLRVADVKQRQREEHLGQLLEKYGVDDDIMQSVHVRSVPVPASGARVPTVTADHRKSGTVPPLLGKTEQCSEYCQCAATSIAKLLGVPGQFLRFIGRQTRPVVQAADEGDGTQVNPSLALHQRTGGSAQSRPTTAKECANPVLVFTCHTSTGGCAAPEK